MAKEPENLVLKQETASTGTGFAMHASLRTQALEKEIADLKKRIDRIERSH